MENSSLNAHPASFGTFAPGEKRDRFVNGEITDFLPWYDTDGNRINCSDGGILFAEGAWHWYGMALRDLPCAFRGMGGQTTVTGVVMYRSEDLYNWEYEGVILPCRSAEGDPLRGPMRMERPKILFDRDSGKYVLWCHYVAWPGDHGTAPGTAEAGRAVADRVSGPYLWLGTCRPIDENGLVRDLTAFTDRSGDSYLVYDREESSENRCLHAVKLKKGLTETSEDWTRIGPAYRREAAALTFHRDMYYMFTSGLTSWDFNRARYYRSPSVMGPWEDMGDPCIGDEEHTTFRTQSTFILELPDRDMKILMLERHNTASFARCSYIWLPLAFDGEGRLTVSYLKEWAL